MQLQFRLRDDYLILTQLHLPYIPWDSFQRDLKQDASSAS